MYIAACIFLFFAGALATLAVTSIGYHRALTHESIQLHPWWRRALLLVGPWITGFDAKTWVIMHRMHHTHSDMPRDPHSPANVGFRGIFQAQLNAYLAIEAALLKKDPTHLAIAKDIDMSWPMRSRMWFAPYVLHIGIGLVLAWFFGWWLGIALIAGLLSHPIQGLIINYFGHTLGKRNFDTADNSRNNHPAALLLFGEGYQNNHHRYPRSARFSYLAGEFDAGYLVCRVLQALHIARIMPAGLIPRIPPSPA